MFFLTSHAKNRQRRNLIVFIRFICCGILRSHIAAKLCRRCVNIFSVSLTFQMIRNATAHDIHGVKGIVAAGRQKSGGGREMF